MNATPWPPLHAYALAHRCTTCGAQPGEPCNAPRKNASLARVDAIRARFGDAPMEHDPLDRMHGPRQDAGLRHYRRDVKAAPWSEDRELGRRYDSLGDAWTPDA